jgi:signal transduction histidine kinase
LSERGLESAIRTLARRAHVPIDLSIRVPSELPTDLAEAVFYIISEALANIAKHAKASSAVVLVEAQRGVLFVSIRDDGVGGADTTGAGLVGLRERAAALGGIMSTHSPHGGGTALTVTFPIPVEIPVQEEGAP